MPIKTQKWTLPNGQTYDLPKLYNGVLENMSATTILGAILPEYSFDGGGTIELRQNTFVEPKDYYDTDAAYGKNKFYEIDLQAPKKIGEDFPYWDQKSDYRTTGYWEEKAALWGKMLGVKREQDLWQLVLSDNTISDSTQAVTRSSTGEEILQAIIDDATKLYVLHSDTHKGIEKNNIKVVVNPFISNKIRNSLAQVQNPQYYFDQGVKPPVGSSGDFMFFESSHFPVAANATEDELLYVIIAVGGLGGGIVLGDPIQTPIERTNDVYKGITYRKTEKVLQPELVIRKIHAGTTPPTSRSGKNQNEEVNLEKTPERIELEKIATELKIKNFNKLSDEDLTLKIQAAQEG